MEILPNGAPHFYEESFSVSCDNPRGSHFQRQVGMNDTCPEFRAHG